MKILVTGGAGFIGSHLCERLTGSGYAVSCIDNFDPFYAPDIKRNNIRSLTGLKNFKLYASDICDYDSLYAVLSQVCPDLVVHLAARAGVRPSIADPALYERVNVAGTINILEACRNLKIDKLMFASSSSVYGGNKKVPFSEEDPVDRPVSPYAATKKAGELICYTYSHLYRLNIFCYRFFTVYGPRQRPEMAIHKFTRKIFNKEKVAVYGDGSSSRDYTYIDDIIDGLVNSIDRIKGYEIINLGNSSPTNIMDLVSLIQETSGIQAELAHEGDKPGDVPRTFADISKAKILLGYYPKTPIKEGVEKFIKWYHTNRQEGLLYE